MAIAALEFNPTLSLTAGFPGDFPDNTRVAYNSRHREYLVVYQYHNSILPGPDQIHGARLSADGKYIANYVISDQPNSCVQPDVAYDPLFDRYLVVWSYTTVPLNTSTGHDWDIYGRFIPWSGPTDTMHSFEIAAGYNEYQQGGVAMATDDLHPRISYSRKYKTFLVVNEAYLYPAYTKAFIMGTKIPVTGTNLWQDLSVIVDDTYSFAHPDVAYDNYQDEFLVVFDVDDSANRMVYGVFVPGQEINGVHQEVRYYVELTGISVGQSLYGGHSHPAVSFCPVTNMYLIVWVTNRHVDAGELFARYLPSRAFVQPSATSYLEKLDSGDFVNLVDVACGANTGQLPNDRRTGDCLVTWTLRHDNAFWSFGRQLTIVDSPVAQLFSHETGFFGPLQNLGALSAWGTGEPRIGVASGPNNFCPVFTGQDSASNQRAYSRMSSYSPLPGWSVVDAGNLHTLAIRTDGSLYAWGDNQSGQLGLGKNITERNTPARIGSDNDWVTVTAGNDYSLGIRTDGSLWSWGDNFSGQLGLGDHTYRTTPVRVGSFTDWVMVSAGYDHSLGIRANGWLYAWGNNYHGALGLGDSIDRVKPERIGSADNWIAVSAGIYASLAIQADGTLWAWGSNDSGQLGLGDNTDRNIPSRVGSANDWVKVSASSWFHSLGIRASGQNTLWAWGNNTFGQLGLGDNGYNTDRNTPAPLNASHWNIITTGNNDSFAINNGALFAWGLDDYGRLGLGETTDRNTPTQVGTWSDWRAIAAGTNHTLGIRSDGTLWAWGWNPKGQLGVGDKMDRSIPTQIFLPKKFPWPMFLPAIINGKTN